MKLANALEKMISRLEEIKHDFTDEDAQADFDSMKAEVIAMLEEMVQLLHDDDETEPEEEE